VLAVRPFWRRGHECVAAFSATVEPFAKPPTTIRDEADAAIAIVVCAFHDTFLIRFWPEGFAILVCPEKQRLSQNSELV